MSRLRVCVVTLWAVLLSMPAAAQDLERWFDLCEGRPGVSLDQQIAGCSALIASGLIKRPDLATSYNNRGGAYLNKGQTSQAIADLDLAIQLDPSFDGAYFNRGSAYAALGQHDRAIADFDQSLRLNPNDSETRELRCKSVAALGRSDPGCGAAAGPRGDGAGGKAGAAATYVGCQAENTGIDPLGLQGRVLGGYCLTSSPGHAGRCAASAAMTVGLCVAECASRGFPYAAVQYRDWCFCGNGLGQAQTSAACTMPCAGNPAEICGGPSANSVFRIRQ